MITLEEGETLVIQVRKHWLFILGHATVLLMFSVVPVMLAPVLFRYITPGLQEEIGGVLLASLYLFLSSAWLWFVLVMFFVMWTNYYLDVLVVTNRRLIDMEQFVLFSRDETIILLENIEDVKMETIGFLATVLHFGNLQIQTAGATKEMVIRNIMRPDQIKIALESCIAESKRAV